MGALKFLTSVVLVSLFAIAVVSLAIQFADDNDAPIDISDDPNMSALDNNLGEDLENLNAASNNVSDTFFTTTQEQGDQSASSGGQFKGGIFEITQQTTETIGIGFKSLFGNNPTLGIFLTALSTVLLFAAVGYGWKYLRGNPD